MLDLLLSRTATVILIVMLCVLVLLHALAIPGQLDSTLLGTVAAALALIYGFRLLGRILRSKSPRTLLVIRRPISWSEVERFDPVDAGLQRATDYTAYTDSFAAAMTVQSYLGALPLEEVRIVTCGLACAYLDERLGQAPSAILFNEQPARAPDSEVMVESALGWLAGIHRDYPDNAPPDSRFVRHALLEAAGDYAAGRSLHLQREWMSLGTEALVANLDYDARRRRLDAQKALTDLDMAETRGLLRYGADRGRALAIEHRNGSLWED